MRKREGGRIEREGEGRRKGNEREGEKREREMEKEKERKGEREREGRERRRVRYYLCNVGTCIYAAFTLGVEWCLLNCDSEYERI